MSDSTQMKEYVSYELMEQIGIETPAHSFMKVMINGEYYGLMLGVEAINETFVAQNYKTTEGYLYKPDGTGSDLIYISDSLDDYEGIEVKMNENSTEKSNLISMIKAINDGEGYEEYLNTDEMIRYFAMNTALVSLDSYQGQMKHNYYLYEDENGVFSILPWDYNMAFGGFGIGMGGGSLAPMSPNADTSDVSVNDKDATQDSAQTAENPQINEGKKQDNSQFLEREKVPMPQGGDRQNGGMMDSGELLSDDAINFSIYEPVSGTTLTDRPLLNVLLSDETILSQYEKYLEQISTEILTEENVTSITMKLGDLLTPYIEEDPSKFYTTEEFLGGVSGENSLSEFAKQRSESILAQLSGELVVESDQTSSMMPPMGGESDEEDANGEPFQNGNVPQMNEEMQGGFDILSMTDEEFEQFLERIQSNNSPIALPFNFDSMTLEEKKAYLTKQMDNLQMPGGAGDRPMMNNEANGKEESTGEFTKEDIYTNLIYLAVLLIVIFAFRRIGK
ncbi:CotH kinase family protein [Psychrobacillus antarcticus]|uniref:CotH kinase family protein n=1 Tax=Psychrobacillus antarcticus TaxID=2879115 RepID=UPI00240812C1|nr:CotH kinase family protein [Psychrobacillus antarcticus]